MAVVVGQYGRGLPGLGQRAIDCHLHPGLLFGAADDEPLAAHAEDVGGFLALADDEGPAAGVETEQRTARLIDRIEAKTVKSAHHLGYARRGADERQLSRKDGEIIRLKGALPGCAPEREIDRLGVGRPGQQRAGMPAETARAKKVLIEGIPVDLVGGKIVLIEPKSLGEDWIDLLRPRVVWSVGADIGRHMFQQR